MNKTSNRTFSLLVMLLCVSGPAYACQIYYDTRLASGTAALFWLSLLVTILYLFYSRFALKKTGGKRLKILFVPVLFLTLAVLVSSYSLHKVMPPCPEGASFDMAICSCVMPGAPPVTPSRVTVKTEPNANSGQNEEDVMIRSIRREYDRQAYTKKMYVNKAALVFIAWFFVCLLLSFRDTKR